MGKTINKIIFFVESPFSRRDYDRFGIEILNKNGFEVEVWDFTPFLFPRFCAQVKVEKTNNFESHHVFTDKPSTLSATGQLDAGCFVVCLVGYRLSTYSIFRELSRNEIPYGVVVACAQPKISLRSRSRIVDKIKKVSIERLMNYIFFKVPYQSIGIRLARLLLVMSGEKYVSQRYPVAQTTEVLHIHALDYDIYLEEMKKDIQTDDKLGVFLDECVPFHPDYLHIGVDPYSSAETYYPAINKFFEFLENKHGMHMMIAAHPRSNYEDHPEYFEGRPIVKGKTAELIRRSRLVIAHSSTSINYAVLFGKPIVFVTTSKLKQSPQGEMIEMEASLLGKKPINIDEDVKVTLEEELKTDKDRYDAYTNDYIKKKGTDELPFWQVFADHIKRAKYSKARD